MKVYYNDRCIGEAEESLESIEGLMKYFLKTKGINSDECYWRWVELDNGRTMIDYGSWSNFFYVDCVCNQFFNDKTRNLPTNKE